MSLTDLLSCKSRRPLLGIGPLWHEARARSQITKVARYGEFPRNITRPAALPRISECEFDIPRNYSPVAKTAMNDGDLLECSRSDVIDKHSKRAVDALDQSTGSLLQDPSSLSTRSCRNDIVVGESFFHWQNAVVWRRPAGSRLQKQKGCGLESTLNGRPKASVVTR
jgi:hypothetical protein